MGDREKAPLFGSNSIPKVRLELHGATITSDAGLLAHSENWMTPWTLPP